MTQQGFCRSAVVASTLTALLASAALPAQQRVSNDFLVTNVRVFDGKGTLPNTQVAVTGGIIRAIGGDPAAWRSLPVVDGTESTLVPGLIDAHVHVRNAGDLRQALRFGVTTVLDWGTVGTTPKEMFAIRTEADAATDRADIRTAGYPATAPGGHFTQYGVFMPVVSTVNGAKETVSMRREQGSDYLKIILNGVRSPIPGVRNLDEPRVRALVEAAHEAGMQAPYRGQLSVHARLTLAAGQRRVRSERTRRASGCWRAATPASRIRRRMG